MKLSASALIFDLDDTLLDTTKYILPEAHKVVCNFLIEAGKIDSFKSFAQLHTEYRTTGTLQNLLEFLAHRLSLSDSQIERSENLFFTFFDSSTVKLKAHAKEVLSDLHGRFDLHLLTSGNFETQEKKVAALGIAELFATVNICKRGANSKAQHFSRIASIYSAPSRVVSIGNRMSTDIVPAKLNGLKGIWVRYGEHAHEVESQFNEKPDVVVEDLKEIPQLLTRAAYFDNLESS
ncbi:MAG: hypothetical protein COT74_03700 [Bdellovibrionales bacterium CG10_big_fil_rev_8_21_14_0_10_45_34]|nr:MAG: hypothetical protein COT74_03700 [Bdellovibrionales bacterium CG10_big_fil_rev_8_21_14_0_10_45_34]